MPDPARDEEARLRALRGMRTLLEAPVDPSFDEIAVLAAGICGAPMAVVALVDGDRQWLLGRLGVAGRQAPRDLGLGAEVESAGPAPLRILRDALDDPRGASNPMLRPPFLARFWAGAPLADADGLIVGWVAILDRAPRDLEPWQAEALPILARQAMRLVEARASLRDRGQRRRDALGALAGGVARELSALLSGILGSVRSIQTGLEPGDPRFEAVRRIQAAAGRAALLTRELLGVSRPRSAAPEILDLNDLVARRADAWRATAGAAIEMTLEPCLDLGPVRADPGEIERALDDSLARLGGALPPGGCLRVATANLEIGAQGAAEGAPAPGRYVEVRLVATHAAGDDRALPLPVHGVDVPIAGDRDLAAVRGVAAEAGGHVALETGAAGTSLRLLLPRATGS